MEYRKLFKIFGITIFPERIIDKYRCSRDKLYHTISEFNKDFNGCLLIDNMVYKKPYVEMFFYDGKSYKRTFNTFEEAKAYGTEQANKGIVVQLIIQN